jgi:hypothetical protein
VYRKGKSVKKRAFIVGSGVILLGFGITGLALMHTGLIHNASNSGSLSLLEEKLPDASPDSSQQAALEAMLPPQAESTTSPAQKSPNGERSAQNREDDQLTNKRAVPVPQVGKGLRRYPNQNQLAQPPVSNRKPQMKAERKTRGADSRNLASKAGAHKVETPKAAASKARASNKQVLTARFSFDPLRNRHIKVARVHSGDRVAIKIRPVGRPDSRLYLAFNTYEDSMPGLYDYGRGSGAVITPVRDNDLLTLAGSRQFGPELSRRLDTREGAILELGAGYHQYRNPLFRLAGYEQGHFEIEIKIYANNKWNIKPRSYL